MEPLAGEIVNQFARLAWASCKVEVIYQSQDAPLIVWADGSRLEQALVNLLRNALRYTSPGGVVMVETVRRGEYAWLCVRDTGIGIPPEELTKIWSRYYRAGSQPQDGLELNAGLGLPLVKEFIEAMGGNVAVESQPGEGSCFSLGLRLV